MQLSYFAYRSEILISSGVSFRWKINRYCYNVRTDFRVMCAIINNRLTFDSNKNQKLAIFSCSRIETHKRKHVNEIIRYKLRLEYLNQRISISK